MANTLKIKRGTAATIPQGQLAEPLFTTDTYDLYIGKGGALGNQKFQKYITSGAATDFIKGDGTLDSTTYQATSEKGQNNGYASLDAGGKIPAAQLPSSVIEYKGTWNANTNTPTLADGTGDAGDVYIVSVGGTQNLGSGSITFDAGDWVMYNGAIWQKSTGSNAVASVNGQTGVVTITFDQLSPMTTLGDLIYGGASGTGTRLAGNITTTKKFLSQTGNATISAAPSWETVTKSDVGLGNVENTALSTWAGSANITTLGTITAGIWNGTTIAIANGGTGQTTKADAFNALSPMTTLGDIIYGGTSGAGTRLAGNTAASKRFLIQTGDGTNSAAPSWGSIAAGDVPTLNQNTTGSAATLTTARTFTIGATGKTFDGSANVSWTLGEIGAQAALTNPVTGTGTNNYIPKFTATGSTIGDSKLYFENSGTSLVLGSIASGFGNSRFYIFSDNRSELYLQFGGNKYANLQNDFGNVQLFANNDGIHGVNTIFYYNGSSASDRYLSFETEATTRLKIEQNGDIRLNKYTSNGFVKTSSANGTLTIDTTSYLPLTGGTLTGALSGTSATFSGLVTISGVAEYLRSVQSGTLSQAQTWYASDGTTRRAVFGFRSANSDNFTLLNERNGSLLIGTNDTTNLTIASTGAATFSSSVTATSGFFGPTSNQVRLTSQPAFQNATLNAHIINADGTGAYGSGDLLIQPRSSSGGGANIIAFGTSNNTDTVTERMRITSGGNVLAYQNYIVSRNGSDTIGAGAFLSLQTASGTNYQQNIQLGASGSLDFWNYDSSSWNMRMRITSGGNIEATGSIKTGAPSGGTAKPWKFGARVADTNLYLDSSQYIELEVDGTTYKLATVVKL